MNILNDKRGVSAMSIMLLALLVLSVVLLNGISITLKNNEAVEAQETIGIRTALGYCNKSHEKHPIECNITEIYRCDSNYLLRSACYGVGDIILSNSGDYVRWCGYASLDGQRSDCGRYWFNEKGKDCTKFNNLCLNK